MMMLSAPAPFYTASKKRSVCGALKGWGPADVNVSLFMNLHVCIYIHDTCLITCISIKYEYESKNLRLESMNNEPMSHEACEVHVSLHV